LTQGAVARPTTPTFAPTLAPTFVPAPTHALTLAPTHAPTLLPTTTLAPTLLPTAVPPVIKVQARVRGPAKVSVSPTADPNTAILNVEFKGTVYNLPYQNLGPFQWNGNVDLIADASGSMGDCKLFP